MVEVHNLQLEEIKGLNGAQFGPSLLPQFQLDPKLKHFNNGSYGTVPKAVRSKRIEWLDAIESHPDKYILDIIPAKLESNLGLLSDYLNCSVSDITFINNATEGANIVLKSFTWSEEDTLLYLSTTYKAVALTVQYLVDTYNIKTVVIDDDNDQVLHNLRVKLEELEAANVKVKLAIVDTISSIPGLILPYQAMIDSLKQYDIPVMVDGAHAFGSIDIDLRAIGADYFFTNLHKWGYCYRPTAVLYVNEKHHQHIQPAITSYGYKTPSLRERFEWPGTIDFSTWLSAEAGLEFRKQLGDKNIKQYLHELAWKGGNLVAQQLGTEILGKKHQVSSMINFPLFSNTCTKKHLDNDASVGKKVLDLINDKFNSRIKTYQFNNQWYIRLSAQIFLELKDFEYLGNALVQVIDLL